MTKDQFKKANDLMTKIKSTADVISRFNEPRKVRRIQISTCQDECHQIRDIDTLFCKDNSLHSSTGLHGNIFLSRANILAKDYIKSMIHLYNDQLDSLEEQLEEIK